MSHHVLSCRLPSRCALSSLLHQFIFHITFSLFSLEQRDFSGQSWVSLNVAFTAACFNVLRWWNPEAGMIQCVGCSSEKRGWHTCNWYTCSCKDRLMMMMMVVVAMMLSVQKCGGFAASYITETMIMCLVKHPECYLKNNKRQLASNDTHLFFSLSVCH